MVKNAECSKLFKVVQGKFTYLEQWKTLENSSFSVVVVKGVQDVQGNILLIIIL